jgi:hypothetical protein
LTFEGKQYNPGKVGIGQKQAKELKKLPKRIELYSWGKI